MLFDELKDKAQTLPLSPGVYIMRDKHDRVIYVGKAKKLKNRVSQYFVDTSAHSPKTRMMISKIHHFDVIVTTSEFEALVLECSLIKQHLPKYNILLKDDKGYPYIRLNTNNRYPNLELVAKISDDGAEYFGPFGSRGVTQNLINAIQKALQIPSCNKHFPNDIGKSRVCLNYHMNQCSGWCQAGKSEAEYVQLIHLAKQLLSGKYKQVADNVRTQMIAAADDLNFELAAILRDRLNVIESLGQKQLVTAGTLADTDVIGYAQTATKACFTVLHFSGGNLLDKEFEAFPTPDDPETAVSSLIKQYYLSRGFAPKVVLVPFEFEDSNLFVQLLEEKLGRRTKVKHPLRGDNARLVEMANNNAQEEAQRITDKEDELKGTLKILGNMLLIDPPSRIESYDISNTQGSDVVGSMVVFFDGKPRRSEYKKFKINLQEVPDDYASMRQMLTRRFSHYTSGDDGFNQAPDLILIDGGIKHAAIAADVLYEHGLDFPVAGMVKDDRHRTRALVTPGGAEIAIVGQQSVFALIGSIQEETHRFAISYHKQLRSKRLQYSELDNIVGIGPKRKELLLKVFKSLSGIAGASRDELERFLPADAAQAVYLHFHEKTEG